MLTPCALLLILQTLNVSARLGWKEECNDRPSVECDGVMQKMTRKDCEAGYEFVYCAKSGVFDDNTGKWIMRPAVFSTHHRIEEPRCIIIGDREIRVVLPDEGDVDTSDLINICEKEMEARDQHKPKSRSKRIDIITKPTTSAPAPANATAKETNDSEDHEQQPFGISYLTVHNLMFINAMAIFVFVIVIAIRRSTNNEEFQKYYYDDIPTNPECDGAVYTPCVAKVNTISNPYFVE